MQLLLGNLRKSVLPNKLQSQLRKYKVLKDSLVPGGLLIPLQITTKFSRIKSENLKQNQAKKETIFFKKSSTLSVP